MKQQTITITNKTGLHARPASLFVDEAMKFKSDIQISNGLQKVSAKSILNILSMGISKGAEITLIAEGEDEAEAIKRLAQMVRNELDE